VDRQDAQVGNVAKEDGVTMTPASSSTKREMHSYLFARCLKGMSDPFFVGFCRLASSHMGLVEGRGSNTLCLEVEEKNLAK